MIGLIRIQADAMAKHGQTIHLAQLQTSNTDELYENTKENVENIDIANIDEEDLRRFLRGGFEAK
jgi:hypothetical protein